MEGQPDNNVTAPVVAGQGDTAQSAPALGETVQPAPGQGETPQPAPVSPVPEPAKGPIPYERFEEVNKGKKAAEEQAAQLQSQLMQAQGILAQIAARQAPQAPPAPQTPLAKYTEADMLDPAKSIAAMQAVYDDLQNKIQAAVGQVQFQTQYGDFEQYVGVQNPVTGQWMFSEPLQAAYKENPQLGRELQAPDSRVFAYRIAKMQQTINDLRAKQQPNPAPTPIPPPTLSQTLRAAQQPTPPSISAAVGAGQIDKVSQVANMTDAQFQAAYSRLKAGGKFEV